MRRLRHALAAALLVLAASACGAPQHVDVQNDIAITISPPTDSLPFDARGARLRSATDQLTRIAGHPIAMQIDAALASAFRSDFERQLIDAIERMARGLEQWKAEDPAAFARSTAALRKVECRYRATVTRPESDFDAATGVLHVDLGAHPGSLVPQGAFVGALVHEDDEYRERTYGAKTAATVATGERHAYFTYLVRTRPGHGQLARRSHDAVVAEVVVLHGLATGSDPELAATTRAWLFDQLAYFHNVYDGPSKPPASFRPAEIAFARFLNEELPKASAKERLEAARQLYGQVPADAYPGVDRFAFGLAVVDEWVRAGRPAPGPSEDPQLALYEEIVCPIARGPRGERDRSSGCASAARGWLRYAVSDEPHRARLARALDERNDAALADQVFSTLYDAGVMSQLDPRKASFRAAIDVLAAQRGNTLETEGARLWKEHPEHRGSALFLIAKSRSGYDSYSGDEYWSRFARSYGASVDAAMLGGMLSHGAAAFAEVPKLWLALAPGFSRVDVLLPRLDSFLPDATSPSAGDVLRPLSRVVGRLCDDHNAGDLAKLQSYLARRSVARPAEMRALSTLQRDTAPGGCKGRTKHAAEVDSSK